MNWSNHPYFLSLWLYLSNSIPVIQGSLIWGTKITLMSLPRPRVSLIQVQQKKLVTAIDTNYADSPTPDPT
jgi:hypothetical protein